MGDKVIIYANAKKSIVNFAAKLGGIMDKYVVLTDIDISTVVFRMKREANIKGQCNSIEEAEVDWKIWIHSAHPSSLTQFRNSESSQ